jgi:hypothetical protein
MFLKAVLYQDINKINIYDVDQHIAAIWMRNYGFILLRESKSTILLRVVRCRDIVRSRSCSARSDDTAIKAHFLSFKTSF